MKTAAVRDLHAAAYNPRKITAAQLDSLGRAMREFGDLGGVIFNRRTGNLVGGHQRVKQLESDWRIGKRPAKDKTGTVAVGEIATPWGILAYREVDWHVAKEKAANLAANKHGGAWDDEKLKEILAGFADDPAMLDLAGFSALDLQRLGIVEPGGGEDELPEPPKKSVTKLGALWRLGEHRLLCGDSMSKADTSTLFGHDRAALVFTDPPYGVSYEAKSGDFDVIEGDRKRDDELVALVSNALKQAVARTTDAAAFYIWHASSTREDFVYALRAAGLEED